MKARTIEQLESARAELIRELGPVAEYLEYLDEANADAISALFDMGAIGWLNLAKRVRTIDRAIGILKTKTKEKAQ